MFVYIVVKLMIPRSLDRKIKMGPHLNSQGFMLTLYWHGSNNFTLQ